MNYEKLVQDANDFKSKCEDLLLKLRNRRTRFLQEPNTPKTEEMISFIDKHILMVEGYIDDTNDKIANSEMLIQYLLDSENQVLNAFMQYGKKDE